MADNNILGGTWYFNDTLTDTTPINVSVNFICYVDNELWECTRLEYKDTGWLVFIKSDNAVLAYDSNSWTIRYITFKSNQTNETLLAWMQANATKLPSENIIFNSVEDYLSQIALLQDNMHNLIVSEGGAKPAYSIEQYMKALINTRESFAAFLNANGVTANLSEKISPAWVDKFKIALNNYIKGGSAIDIYNDELTSLDNGYYSMKPMRSLTCPNVVKINNSACCGFVGLIMSSSSLSSIQINYNSNNEGYMGGYLEEINFPKCTYIYCFYDTLRSPQFQLLGAFAYRTKLKTINMPLLEKIEGSAFLNCTTLESVSFPSLKNCGSYDWFYSRVGAFQNCTRLINFDAPNMETIGAAAFKNCTKLESIPMENVRSVSNDAFSGCQALKEIVLPKVTNMYVSGSGHRPSRWASGCRDLEVFSLPNCEDVIQPDITEFAKLRVINIPKVSIVNGNMKNTVYSNPIPLEEFHAESLTGMYNYTFYGLFNNPDLKMWDLEFPLLTKLGNYDLGYCAGLKSFSAPILTTTGTSSCYTFRSCTNLEQVYMPLADNIGEGMFQDCPSLKKVTSGASTIYNYAFRYCTQSFDLYLGYDGVVKLNSVNAFGSTTATKPVTLHVKPDYADSYATATNWSSLIAQGKIIIVGDYSD